MFDILNFLNSVELYNKIDNLRINKGLSIYAMAKDAGVSCATIYKWRDRKSSPSLYLIESLCDVLEIHIANLFIDEKDLIYLQDDEKELFNEWKLLRRDQKSVVLGLIKSLRENMQK